MSGELIARLDQVIDRLDRLNTLRNARVLIESLRPGDEAWEINPDRAQGIDETIDRVLGILGKEEGLNHE